MLSGDKGPEHCISAPYSTKNSTDDKLVKK